MAATPSTMLPLGTPAPDFALPDTAGRQVRRDDFTGRPLLVIFICNHCPYVLHVAAALSALCRQAMARGLAAVAINANDAQRYPADAPAAMPAFAATYRLPFPYLHDQTQAVARAYHAACTPDFFLFDGQHRLAYRGQFDGSRPGNKVPVTGGDLAAAVDAVLSGRPVPEPQTPSLGCGIKWRAA